MDLGERVARRFDLGDPVAPPVPVTGGLLNRMFRLDTTSGSFAVKQLTHHDAPALADYDRAFTVERAVRAAGLDVPEPLPDPEHGGATAEVEPGVFVLVHRWVDGVMPDPTVAVEPWVARSVGDQLALLHRLDLDPARWPRLPNWDACPGEDEWRDRVTAGRAAGRPWAADLAAAAPDLAVLTRRVRAERGPVGPLVVSHRDVGQKNLLVDEATRRAVIIDWEACGPTYVGHELAQTAFDLAAGHTVELDPDRVAALFAGYRSAGGTLPEVSPAWLSEWVAACSVFVSYNARLAAGVHEPDAADHADVREAAEAAEADRTRADRIVADLLPVLRAMTTRWDDLTATLADVATNSG